LFVLAACGFLTSCADRSRPPADAKPVIAVTIYPLADIVEQLVGDAADVACLLPPGQSPHAFELSPRQMATVDDSRLIVAVGLGLDHWVNRAAGSGDRPIVTLADAIGLADDDSGDDSHDHHHHHDHDHDHHDDAHGSADPHLWLDPVLVRQAVDELTFALVKQLPDDADAIRRNAGELEAELIALHEDYNEQLAPFEGRSIVTFHSAFNRLAERYGLEVATTLTPIEAVGNVSPAALDSAIRAIDKHELKALFAEPQFSPDAARMLAQRTGAAVLILDPIGDPNTTDRNGYLPMMRYNLRTLVDGLSR